MNLLQKAKTLFVAILLLGSAEAVCSEPSPSSAMATPQSAADPEVKIGFFLGGRTNLLIRSLIHNDYKKAGLNVVLWTKYLYDEKNDMNHKSYFAVNPLTDPMTSKDFGKARGSELVDLVVQGQVQGATIGESAFIDAVTENKPIVAVEELGVDAPDKPGHGIVLRKGVLKAAQNKGAPKIRLGIRRSSGGDKAFLKEFLVHKGFSNLDRFELVENMPDDGLLTDLIEKKIDGAYFHIAALEKRFKRNPQLKNEFDVHPLTWAKPEMSQGLLVFHRDFIAKSPDLVRRIVRVHMERSALEKKMSVAEFQKEISTSTRGWDANKSIAEMDLPVYRSTPDVRLPLLREMQELLLKHEVIRKKVDFSASINNEFVKKNSTR